MHVRCLPLSFALLLCSCSFLHMTPKSIDTQVAPDAPQDDRPASLAAFSLCTDGPVTALAPASDGTLYFGGMFTQVGQCSGYAVAINASTGNLSVALAQLPAFDK